MAGDSGANAPITDSKPGKDGAGRFAAGNQYSRGRPQHSLTRELRRQTDVVAVARAVIDMALDTTGKVGARERLEALKLVFDRLEGRAVSRNLNMSLSASNALPPHFASLPPKRQTEILDNLRNRALAGELASGDDDDGGDDGE